VKVWKYLGAKSISQ